jgi:hypothetical protein
MYGHEPSYKQLELNEEQNIVFMGETIADIKTGKSERKDT